MELPGRRGVARGPQEMGAPGGEEAAAGPARFRCPEDFCARRFAPALCLESLRAGGKRLLLIRAPVDFRPESLAGQSVPLLGARLVRAAQPDGSPRVYSLQAGPEESASRLLLTPAAQPDRLACAQPFSGSLSIRERRGDPGAPQPLFPVAERPAPRVPGGLKQRFFPFGARLQGQAPPSDAAGKAARKRNKKRRLLPLKQELWQPEGPGQLPGGSAEPAGGPLARRAGHKQRLLEEEEDTNPAVLPVLGGRLLGQDARLEEGSLPEEADRRRAKKEKKRKASLEAEELPAPNSRDWQPEPEPEEGGGRCARDSLMDGGRPKKRTQEAGAGGLWGVAAVKEEPVDDPCPEGLLEEGLGAAGEGPAGEPPGYKKKKKKNRERGAEELWGRGAAIKEEPMDVPCLGVLPEGGLGSSGRELPGYIKQSPGKGAEGLWGVKAVKEELGAVPCLGTLAEGSRGTATEEPPGCRKKKKKKSREEGRRGITQELGDIGSLGGLPEESQGSAGGELLTCQRKRKRKLDEEPLQEQAAETQRLEPTVLDWGVPLCRGEPLQANGAAPRPKKKRRGRTRPDSAAGT